MLGLSNRETALTLWIAVIAVVIFATPGTRKMLPGLVKQSVAWKILVPLTIFTAYVAAVTWAAAQLGWWDWSLIGPTIFWFLTSALGLFLNSNDAINNKAHYRRVIAGTIGVWHSSGSSPTCTASRSAGSSSCKARSDSW